MSLTDQEIRRRVQTLPERFQDRLPYDYPRLSRDRDSGELEEVVENLVAALRQGQILTSTSCCGGTRWRSAARNGRSSG